MANGMVAEFEFVDLGKPGMDYEDDGGWKVELHMTQGDSIEGAEGAFAPYPPHGSSEYEGRKRHQYVPLTRAAYSNLGSHSDKSRVIQWEIVGMSENAPNFWPEELDWIGTDVLAPIHRELVSFSGRGFDLVSASQGFHGAAEGIKPYLATPQSPIRFRSDAELDAFSGILGHQHMPAPDDHWDPGLLDTARILTACAWALGQNPAPPVYVPIAPDSGPAPTPPWYSRVLKVGVPWGFDVHRAQTRLYEEGHGYGMKLDGWFGPKTEFSTKSFQRERGLDDDGVIGPDTARALGA